MIKKQEKSSENLLSQIFPVGTRSVLWGVHQFLWHPFTVWLAWRRLYGQRPSFWESVAILLHDTPGYLGKKAMDSPEGEQHPFTGAWAIWYLYLFVHPKGFKRAEELFWLVLLHSRYLSARLNKQPSKLAWADKLSMSYDPAWFYLFRARLSGEIHEYREQSRETVSLVWPDEYWFVWCRNKCARDAHEKRVAKPRNHATV